MSDAGTAGPDLPLAATIDELLGNRVTDGLSEGPVRISRGDLAALIGADPALSAALTARVDEATEAANLATEKAENAQEAADAAAAAAPVTKATWAALSAITGTYDGQPGRCTAASGTHTDPVVGGSVNDGGEYAWSASPAGWQRVSDLKSYNLAAPGDRTSTDKADTPANVATAITDALTGYGGGLSASYGTPITGLSQSGWRYVVEGSDGNLLFGVDDSARPGFVVDGLIELNPAYYPKLQMNLGGTLISYWGAEGYSQSGRVWSLEGSDGNELFGVSDDAFPEPTGAMSPFQNARPEFVADPAAGYELFTRRDANNFMQVWSRNLATFAVTQLSEPGLDNINPRFDAARKRAVWSCSGADRWPSNRLRARRLDGFGRGPSHAYPQKKLNVWGDSVDNGSVASPSSNSYANLIATALGLAITNRAIGGQQSWQQAMQMGAIPTLLTIPATAIATAGTAVSAIGTVSPRTGATITRTVARLDTAGYYPNTMLLSTVADATTRTLNGWVVDVAGIMRRVALTRTAVGVPSTSEAYTVTSLTGAQIDTVSTVVRFIPDNADQLSSITTIGGGLNDLGQGYFATTSADTAANILADVRAVQDAMVDALGPACAAYLVMGMYNQASAFTTAGSDADLAIIASNNIQRVKHAGRFVDRWTLLNAAAVAPGDNTDVANHWIPTSQRGDGVHPSNSGHGNIANGNSGGLGAIALLTPQLAAIPT